MILYAYMVILLGTRKMGGKLRK